MSESLPASQPFNEHETPWSTVGYLTYKRTYSRRLVEDDVNAPTEEWADTINRVINAANEQLKCGFTHDEEQRLRYYMTKLKGTVAGRFLWQLGTPMIPRLGLPSLQNCAFVAVDEAVRPFTWAMDMLMLGSGVGFSIQKEHVSKLPPVKKGFVGPTRHDKADADFIIPDTREGWVALLERTLEAAFARRKSESFTYSTQLIRGKGAPIKGFGGVASGAEILCQGIAQITEILAKRAGKHMRPIDCLDVMNIIGSIVVAGNVRRSAQLAIGDPDDVEYLFWVGCAGAYEERAKKTTKAVAELLYMSGVKFGVLGARETCTGDPARRAGNEFLYQILSRENIETFNEVYANYKG